MKFAQTELDRLKTSHISIAEPIEIAADLLVNHPRCIGMHDIYAEGSAFYERETSQFIVDVRLSGVMVVPCAISLKPVDLDFSIRYSENFAFDLKVADEFESIPVEGDEVDLLPYFMDAIVAEIPLKVIHPDLTEYPKGEGWEVMTEEAYQEAKKQEIDPRLAILKDYKFE